MDDKFFSTNMKDSKICAVKYIGNGAYCYANSSSMLLSSIGENIPPSTIEVLCGIGLSACWSVKSKLIFFNFALPNEELSRAFKILGFECKERIVSKKNNPPINELRNDLKNSPVVIGPLDMGYLTYNPTYPFLGGADHYVLIYGYDDKNIYLHDPEKFPCVSLSFKKLELSWKSKKILYGLENYQYWTAPKRVSKPSRNQIYKQTMKDFASIYRNCRIKLDKNEWITGGKAILVCADRLRRRIATVEEINNLIFFSFPLGAKRALDFASFFDYRDKDLVELKREQARLFGECQSLLMLKKWIVLANQLKKLAYTEERIETLIMEKDASQ